MLTCLRVLGSRIRGFFHGRCADDDFDHELQSHLEMLTQENLRRAWRPRKLAARRACDWEESRRSRKATTRFVACRMWRLWPPIFATLCALCARVPDSQLCR